MYIILNLYCILGSDDSGIICPVNPKNVVDPTSEDNPPIARQSRESLDSGAPEGNDEENSNATKSDSESQTSSANVQDTPSDPSDVSDKKDDVKQVLFFIIYCF